MGALGSGDDATVLGLMDPAIQLVPLVVAAGLVTRPYQGFDGMRAYLDDADAVDVERGFVATRVQGANDTVVAFGSVRDGSEGATMPALWIWRLRDGLATHGTLISDERALRAARDSEPLVGAPPRSAARSALWLELPAVAESAGDARHAVQIWADNLTLTTREHNDLMLAVSEAATNVVRHGYPNGAGDGTFRLSAEVNGGNLRVAVADDGVGLGGTSPNPGLGMGLPLLGRLAESLTFVGPPDRLTGLEVRMWFAVASLAARST
jgi:serine/threonine-protein kinase RsbW